MLENKHFFEDFTVDYHGISIIKDGQTHALSKLEFKLLSYFVENAERFVSRAELMNNIWGSYSVTPFALSQYVCYLRKKIGKNHIKTRRGYGYMFKK